MYYTFMNYKQTKHSDSLQWNELTNKEMLTDLVNKKKDTKKKDI